MELSQTMELNRLAAAGGIISVQKLNDLHFKLKNIIALLKFSPYLNFMSNSLATTNGPRLIFMLFKEYEG